ncbi:MgtC/SapB family protein [Albibacillus kandeliae]|uniref:MgtC/SapB family protein n=1 Tax=Albibacillus kandeliae TaxID=2174228 RepID=UPI0038BD3EF2
MFTRELERSFSEFPPAIATVRLVAAILLGGLIGFEREQRGKSAGLRTHMLVAMAACLFILVSQSLGTLHFGDRAELRVDPLRLVEAVTAGVAFLGAGAIFSSGGQVHNITTGAGMWMAGAIGLACGAGQIPLALLATVITLCVTFGLRWVDRLTGRH